MRVFNWLNVELDDQFVSSTSLQVTVKGYILVPFNELCEQIHEPCYSGSTWNTNAHKQEDIWTKNGATRWILQLYTRHFCKNRSLKPRRRKLYLEFYLGGKVPVLIPRKLGAELSCLINIYTDRILHVLAHCMASLDIA